MIDVVIDRQDHVSIARVRPSKPGVAGSAPPGREPARIASRSASRCLSGSVAPRRVLLELVALMNAAIESYKEMADFGGNLGIKVTFR
jgi:hypothetical protein